MSGREDSALGAAAARIGIRAVDPANPAALDEALEAAFARWRARRYERVWDTEGLFSRVRQSARFEEILQSL